LFAFLGRLDSPGFKRHAMADGFEALLRKAAGLFFDQRIQRLAGNQGMDQAAIQRLSCKMQGRGFKGGCWALMELDRHVKSVRAQPLLPRQVDLGITFAPSPSPSGRGLG